VAGDGFVWHVNKAPWRRPNRAPAWAVFLHDLAAWDSLGGFLLSAKCAASRSMARPTTSTASTMNSDALRSDNLLRRYAISLFHPWPHELDATARHDECSEPVRAQEAEELHIRLIGRIGRWDTSSRQTPDRALAANWPVETCCGIGASQRRIQHTSYGIRTHVSPECRVARASTGA
jgi:hypothetical protein